jgi:GTP diphosphokinase / guanosine-3',5'-bis(diphosphate) 3'-diphosphatase
VAQGSSSSRRRGNHLLEVATLVAEATEGKDPDLVVAALLHDAIEDCEVPHQMIADAFGTDVADLVAEVTDDKRLAKEDRKRLQAETAHKKSVRAKMLKLADKTSTCVPSFQAPRRIGRSGVGWNTSNGHAK